MSNLPPPSFPSPSTPDGSGGSLIETLLSATSATDIRTQEATLMFQVIAGVLDEALDENIKLLPPNFQLSFKDFITYLSFAA